jgi:hypothetical protein
MRKPPLRELAGIVFSLTIAAGCTPAESAAAEAEEVAASGGSGGSRAPVAAADRVRRQRRQRAWSVDRRGARSQRQARGGSSAQRRQLGQRWQRAAAGGSSASGGSGGAALVRAAASGGAAAPARPTARGGSEGPPPSSGNKAKMVKLDTTAAGAPVMGDVLKYPVAITLDATNFDFASAKSKGEDIRFATMEGTALPFEIEFWDATAKLAGPVGEGRREGQRHADDQDDWGDPNAASASDGKSRVPEGGRLPGCMALCPSPAA